MSRLVQIGNSKGVRIPKNIIQQADLENKEISFKVIKEGLLITPNINKPRLNWEEKIANLLSNNNDEVLDEDWLNADLDNLDNLDSLDKW